jgi:hypothetical protein
MRNLKLWTTLAASGVLALALATAAIAAGVGDTSSDTGGPGTLPDKANAAAVAAVQRHIENANPADETAAETEADDEDTGQAQDTSPKPGWGCGDTNHTHTGPSGNPGATSPCDASHH